MEVPPKFQEYLEDNGYIGTAPSNHKFQTEQDSQLSLKDPLERITFWSTYAAKFEFGDGTSRTIGSPKGDSTTLHLSLGQKCDSASIWTADDSSFNGIQIVSGSEILKAGPCTGTKYPLSIGSGLLLGFGLVVSANVHPTTIYSVNLLFLKPVKSVVSKVNNINLPHGRQGIHPVTVDTFHASNEGHTNPNYKWGKAVKKSTSASWHQKASVTFGVSMTVSAGVPAIAGVSDTAQWSVTAEISHDSTETEEKTLEWSISGPLKSGQSINCVAVSQEGKVDIDYDSEVTVTLTSGKSLTFKETGRFKRLDYSEVSVEIK